MSFDIKTYGDADKKMIKRLGGRGKFDASFSTNVDMSKVNIEVMGRWVQERVTELLGFEDEVVINLITNLLERKTDALTGQLKKCDPKELQVQLTGFLAKQAGPFTAELWHLLIDASTSPSGIPKAFVEKKKHQLSMERRTRRDDSKYRVKSRRSDDKAASTVRKIVEAQRSSKDDKERRRRRSASKSSSSSSSSDDSEDDDAKRRKKKGVNFASSDEPSRKRVKKGFGDVAAEEQAEEEVKPVPSDRPPLPAPWEWRESRSKRGEWYCVNSKTGEKKWSAEAVTKKKKKKKRTFRVQHVLVKHVDSRRPSSWRSKVITLTKQDAKRELERIHRAIASNSDRATEIARIAKLRSDCPSASKGGALKPFGSGELDKVFEAAALKLQPGELSPLIDTDSGLHIILRLADDDDDDTDAEPAVPPPPPTAEVVKEEEQQMEAVSP